VTGTTLSRPVPGSFVLAPRKRTPITTTTTLTRAAFFSAYTTGLLAQGLKRTLGAHAAGPALQCLTAAVELGHYVLRLDSQERLAGCAIWFDPRGPLQVDCGAPAAQWSERTTDGDARSAVVAFEAAAGEAMPLLREVRARVLADGCNISVRGFLLANGSALARRWTTPGWWMQQSRKARRASIERAETLGHALLAQSKSPPVKVAPLHRLVTRLNLAIHIQQMRLALSDDGTCEGFITWAWLTDAALEKARRLGVSSLHPSDWDEGDQLCVLDLVAIGKDTDRVRARLLAELGADERAVLCTPPNR
jgi:hemolysin-activating ACP:hemolysin acyltransferase